MKRIPFSYSTFAEVQDKAKTRAAQEGHTVSTVIHRFLITYTKDEVSPSNQAPPVDAGTPLPIANEPAAETETHTDELSAPIFFVPGTDPISAEADDTPPAEPKQQQTVAVTDTKPARVTQQPKAARQKGKTTVKKGKQSLASKKKR
ncbi:hypothetical protein [Chitinophaga tropicalis]|uniref:Uncharacterized protein n=1 Tax=Chitinophaga tropicalis TaxID=2683588 RepID=A0A7K1U165_9BACT|nr:hypothetical protein [Chitinophaga tropicalis]MVT07745.1 hypothetical protein [Chitinophaga tropicalis]